MDIIITKDKLFNNPISIQEKLYFVSIQKDGKIQPLSHEQIQNQSIEYIDVKKLLTLYNKETIQQQILFKNQKQGINHFQKLRDNIKDIRNKLDIYEKNIDKLEQQYNDFNQKDNQLQSNELTDFLLKMTSKQDKTQEMYQQFIQELQQISCNVVFENNQNKENNNKELSFQIKEHIKIQEKFSYQFNMQQKQLGSIQNILNYNISETNLIHPEDCSEERRAKSFNDNYSYVFNPFLQFEALRRKQQTFATERQWDQYHNPRNLLLALMGEIGELCELFQWKGEVEGGLKGFTYEEKVRVGEEMSDCLLYLIRFADMCRLDFCNCVERKILYNGIKYPPKHCKGSSEKYTSYTHITNH